MDSLEGDFRKFSLKELKSPHSEIMRRAISNILSCPIAETTYALILDGLPTAEVALDVYDSNVSPGHPLLDEHKELCPGVLEKARELRVSFDPGVLQIDSRLAFAFQAAPPGSRVFNTRLIELAAVAVHQIAVWLFKTNPSLHKDDKLGMWQPPEELEPFYPHGFPKTLFRHKFYQDADLYPEGLADVVGYWAESRIFGGVIVFDRREPDSAPDVDPNAVYMHADRRDVMYRIFKLLDTQKHQLVEFLLSEDSPPVSCPLPILGDANNRHRVDPEEPIEETGIYRDKWERRPTPIESDRRFRDVLDLFNYLSDEDYYMAQDRAWLRKEKQYRESD